MAGPGLEIPAGAGGRSRLRASHADREQVIGVLKAAFVQGRLDRDELDTRLGRTLAARTRAELAALTADIPAGLTVTPPVQAPAPERADKNTVMALACATAAVTIPVAALPVAWAVTDARVSGQAVMYLVIAVSVIWVPLAAVLLQVLFVRFAQAVLAGAATRRRR